MRDDTAARTPEAIDRLDFETALKQLEGIVAALESGHLPLEQALTQYETGVRLVHHARTLLQAAEERLVRIESLHRQTAAAENGATRLANESTPATDDSDDIPF
ncbi:exodeoxyribonuclease VII small subunit [Hydrogenophilus thiooxidans]|uniref:exodeoxyribonuclease VII small subunit n=1 Tax=Hydrogenophilus thiooxidans TaxID=2820326 RepID=UPI001C23B025|nr:exodeoxyribonuclease VII small subunit [Hydrogenophilus thiooxidans]